MAIYKEDLWYALIISSVILLFTALVGLMMFSKWDWSEENVSGIVYSTTNNGAISGQTTFKVRAGLDTYIDKDTNESGYCLPKDSPYKDLVNKAAANKEVRVQVTTKKGFWIKAPWTCVDNVTVLELE